MGDRKNARGGGRKVARKGARGNSRMKARAMQAYTGVSK